MEDANHPPWHAREIGSDSLIPWSVREDCRRFSPHLCRVLRFDGARGELLRVGGGERTHGYKFQVAGDLT